MSNTEFLVTAGDDGTVARLEEQATLAFESLRKYQARDLITPFDKVDLERWLCPCADSETVNDLQSVITYLQADLESIDLSDTDLLKAGCEAFEPVSKIEKMVAKLAKAADARNFDPEKFNADLHDLSGTDTARKLVRLSYERARFVMHARLITLEAVATFSELGIICQGETREYLEALSVLVSEIR